MFPQGFISGFALIPPWALQECRAYGTRKAGQPYQNNKVIDWWRKRKRAL